MTDKNPLEILRYLKNLKRKALTNLLELEKNKKSVGEEKLLSEEERLNRTIHSVDDHIENAKLFLQNQYKSLIK